MVQQKRVFGFCGLHHSLAFTSDDPKMCLKMTPCRMGEVPDQHDEKQKNALLSTMLLGMYYPETKTELRSNEEI